MNERAIQTLAYRLYVLQDAERKHETIEQAIAYLKPQGKRKAFMESGRKAAYRLVVQCSNRYMLAWLSFDRYEDYRRSS